MDDRIGLSMAALLDHPAEQIEQLQRCIGDLITLVSLPASWDGAHPTVIARTLLDTLGGMLELDLLFIRLIHPYTGSPLEMVRAPRGRHLTARPHTVGTMLDLWLGEGPREGPVVVRNHDGEGELSIVALPIGRQGDLGVLVAGAERPDFPTDTEQLLLTVARNQALIAQREAHLVGDFRRVAGELDLQVARRTAELAAANADLQREAGERQRAEEALRASERNLGQIINAIPALAWSARPDGSADFFNRHYLDYVGLSAEEAGDWGWTRAVHPDDLAVLLAAWRGTLAAGRGGESEMRLRRADGVYRWFLARVNPLRDETGTIVRWYGTNTDIDDRKRAEDELRRSEAFLADAQRLSLTGSFWWRVATDEIAWSGQVYRIFEFDAGEPVTLERIGTRVHPDDVAVFSDVVGRARSEGSDFEYEMRLLMPDRSVRHLHVVAHAGRDRRGGLEYLGAVQDVTARRRSEQALDQARSELAHVARITTLGTLTASIAHEVNQPLAGIVTNASTCLRMLAADPPNLDGARETARRTIRDGHRASEVVGRVRGLFGRKEVAAEPVDLNEAAREVIALSAGELRRGRVVVREELANGLPPVSGDRVQLQQVILNLLLNGADAMSAVDDRPRTLVVESEADDEGVRLWVQDSGIGFAPEDAARLFDAFYTTKADGMGIGLSVSRSIVERHGGRLWASRNEGPGATFGFTIPVAVTRTAGSNTKV